MAVVIAPDVPECVYKLAHALRPDMSIVRMTYDAPSRSVYTIIESDPDDVVSARVLEEEKRCLQVWPPNEPFVSFDVINLADFPDDQHEQLLAKYRGTFPLLP